MKAFCDSSGARSADGRLFQVVGLLMAELRCAAAVGTLRTRTQLLSTRRGRGRYVEVAEVIAVIDTVDLSVCHVPVFCPDE